MARNAVDLSHSDFSPKETINSALKIFTYLMVAFVVVRFALTSINEQNTTALVVAFLVAAVMFSYAAGNLGICVARRVIDFIQTELQKDVHKEEGQLRFVRRNNSIPFGKAALGVAIFLIVGLLFTLSAWKVTDVLFTKLHIEKYFT